jgi:hypothetical protein
MKCNTSHSLWSELALKFYVKRYKNTASIKLTRVGIIVASSSISHLPAQSTFKSSLIPSVSVFVTRTLESCKGTCPRSSLVKWRLDKGPGSMLLNMGSAISLVILLAAILICGHSCATMSFKNSRYAAV